MTSLQKAAAAAAAVIEKPTYETSNGQFENCFAAGLDLSEFGGNSQKPQRSAASELLQIKEKERRKREEDEREERKMDELVERRVAAMKQVMDQEKTRKDPNIVVNALFQMHGKETDERNWLSKKSRRKMKGQRLSSSPSAKKGASKAHRKSRRSKF